MVENHDDIGPSYQDIVTAQKDLHDAYEKISDAHDRLGRGYPDEQAALTTVHHDLAMVLRAINDRREHGVDNVEYSDHFEGLLVDEEHTAESDEIKITGRVPGEADD